VSLLRFEQLREPPYGVHDWWPKENWQTTIQRLYDLCNATYPMYEPNGTVNRPGNLPHKGASVTVSVPALPNPLDRPLSLHVDLIGTIDGP
jgi:hypothetical protein